MLKVDGVGKRYGRREVLRDISLAIGSEIRVIIGLNGSGKSTLLKIIAGILPADGGRVVLGGRDATFLPPEERRIGYVPQHPALFSHLSVDRNIRYGMRREPGSENLFGRLVSMLELHDVLEARPLELSGGYRSRVCLARALAAQPLAVLLDEPFSAVDAAVKKRLLPQFRTVLASLGVPVLCVTHDPWEAEQLGDSFAVLSGGRITLLASAREAFVLAESGRYC